MDMIQDTIRIEAGCGGERIDRFLCCALENLSRSYVQKLLKDGNVIVNGKIVKANYKVNQGDEIQVRIPEPEIPDILPEDIPLDILYEDDDILVVNKPKGIVCTEEKRERNSIVRFLNYPVRVTYVGRLDKDSRGLLLMTNNGDIINKMMRAGNYHEKEYLVTVDKPVTEEFLQHMARGVPILDTVTRPCQVKKEGKKTFRIVLTQGLNRQIRRMCEALGYKVVTLKRVRIMQIRLGDLKPGQYRPLTEQELASLDRMLEHSSNMPERDRKNRERKENRRQKP